MCCRLKNLSQLSTFCQLTHALLCFPFSRSCLPLPLKHVLQAQDPQPAVDVLPTYTRIALLPAPVLALVLAPAALPCAAGSRSSASYRRRFARERGAVHPRYVWLFCEYPVGVPVPFTRNFM
jgi:hypothetical protein